MTQLTNRQKAEIFGFPLIVAMFVGIGYFYIRPWLNTLIAGDEGAMTSGMIAFLGTLYAIIGGFCVFEVLKQWNAVFEAYHTHNMKL